MRTLKRCSIQLVALLSLLLLAACSTSPTMTPEAVLAPTTTSTRILPTNTPRPTETPLPTQTLTPVPKSISIPQTPTIVRIACNLRSPYLGVSQPGNAMYLVDLQSDCVARITPGGSDKVYGWGSWLPDGSGFVYLESNRGRTSINVCVWNLATQATTRCFLEGVKDYLQAVWSPGNTNYVAYRRWDSGREKEFLVIVSQSGEVLYNTEQNLLAGGEERFLAWQPDGRQVLLAVDNAREQAATVVNVETSSRVLLAQFDKSREYLVRGVWVNEGQEVVLSTIDPELCCTGERRPDAKNIYQVRNDGTKFRSLVEDLNIASFSMDHNQRRLLIDTYSNGNDPNPVYWLELGSGKLTRVLGDDFEKQYPRVLGLTPDDRYIVSSDGQYRTWSLDTRTGQLTRLSMEIYDTIEWRP